jgi:cellulose synthase operon protein C
MTIAGKTWRANGVLGECLFAALFAFPAAFPAACLLACLVAVQGTAAAQRQPGVSGADEARRVLVEKAHALETRGRPDMAVQSWQQILLSEPDNAEALAGLARDYKLIGSNDLANQALARLRKINPNDPNIAKIEQLTSTRVQTDQLRQAGELARQGKPDQAIRIYRSLFGDHPPDGDIALAYYETLYGTDAGKEQAIAAMRALAQRNPGDTRYAIALGRMLTYRANTRAEGIRILESYPKDGVAQTALRQALIWDAANPASAAELRQYAKEHPKDTEIATDLKEDESKLAQMNGGIARTPEEREAFAALSDKRLGEAQSLFYAILQKDPKDGRAAAGMGFLRMRQNNFAGAISYLTQAEQSGFKDATVENALEGSRFWLTMGEASQAIADRRLDEAESRYRAALTMRPSSPEALAGLAGLMVRQQQFAPAADIYQKLVEAQAGDTDAWRGLFLALAQENKNKEALAVQAKLPQPVEDALSRDPEYLRTLAAVFRAEHRDADAQRVLGEALALPFPNNGANLKIETRLEYASILMEANRFDQAAEIYIQILNEDSSNLSAWMGLVSAQHELHRDREAIAEVERMSPSTYEAALADSGFLSMLGSIYQQVNQPEIAESLLERAARLVTAGGKKPGTDLELQLAAIDLQRGNTAQAYGIYHEVLVAHPERVEAWKGLIATLQSAKRTAAALEELALIPPTVRRQLEADVEFNASEASLYAANGDYGLATEYMTRVENHYAALGIQPPAPVAIQSAWLLFNTHSDRALYPALMALGGRGDLTAEQRVTVQDIWAQWSVRRAEAAIDDGNTQRGKDLLDATFQAFPDNLTVRKAVAAGYLTAGRARESLAIFKTLPMQDALPADYQGAVGAALAAGDLMQAETWLRHALERYAADPQILGLAARFEQARGNNQRAAEYWRASLAAMPAPTATDKLAHDLSVPDQPAGTKRANTPADLARLLDPENEPFPRTNRLPPLPAYGPDPYSASAPAYAAPMGMTAPQPAPQPIPQSPVAPSTPQAPPAGSPISGVSDPLSGGAQLSTVYIPPAAGLPQPAQSEEKGPDSPSSSIDAAIADAPTGEPIDTQSDTETASAIRALPNAPIPPPVADGAETLDRANESKPETFALAQYTPSAQEAASGAYSSPKQQPNAKTPAPPPPAAQPVPHPPVVAPAAAPAAPTATKARRAHPKTAAAAPASTPTPSQTPAQTTPTLMNAPGTAEGANQGTNQGPNQGAPQGTLPQTGVMEPQPSAAPAESYVSEGTGLSDQQLQDRNLPPLRGSWVRVLREQQPVTPQEEAQTQLQSIENGYSPWAGGTGTLNYRSGDLGYDHLSALESPFESSMPFGYNARITFIAKPVFLDSGQADGSAVLSVEESSSAGNALVSIPEPLGTDVNTGASTTTAQATTTHIPLQQNAAGVGGEVQLAFPDLAIAGGYTPAGFLVGNATARANWRPDAGPFTLSFVRDSIKDSQLSYAGLRDPGATSLGHEGQIWGGVIANQGNAQYSRGDASSGFYLGAGGQYISGVNVRSNNRIDGSGGSYWRVLSDPEHGTLSVGANFFAMHYGNNQLAYTFGMGGYFSPQAYLLANVPLTWNAHSGARWHYNLLGSFGVQAFKEDSEPLWPLFQDRALEAAEKNASLPAKTSVGPNYDLRAQTAYAINPNWYAGGFFGANNARNYTSASIGFYIRYLFRPQIETVAGPTGLFPTDGFRPFRVP